MNIPKLISDGMAAQAYWKKFLSNKIDLFFSSLKNQRFGEFSLLLQGLQFNLQN